MSPFQVAALGAAIGVPLGYAMQRTNLCFNSAYREAFLNRSTILLRAIALAILVQMVGLAIIIPNTTSSLRMLPAGGMMGISATIAGGCNIGHTFSGVPTLALNSLTATLFIFLGAWCGNYLRFQRPMRINILSTEAK